MYVLPIGDGVVVCFRCFPVAFGCLWLVVSGVFSCSVCVCFVCLVV